MRTRDAESLNFFLGGGGPGDGGRAFLSVGLLCVCIGGEIVKRSGEDKCGQIGEHGGEKASAIHFVISSLGLPLDTFEEGGRKQKSGSSSLVLISYVLVFFLFTNGFLFDRNLLPPQTIAKEENKNVLGGRETVMMLELAARFSQPLKLSSSYRGNGGGASLVFKM